MNGESTFRLLRVLLRVQTSYGAYGCTRIGSEWISELRFMDIARYGKEGVVRKYGRLAVRSTPARFSVFMMDYCYGNAEFRNILLLHRVRSILCCACNGATQSELSMAIDTMLKPCRLILRFVMLLPRYARTRNEHDLRCKFWR